MSPGNRETRLCKFEPVRLTVPPQMDARGRLQAYFLLFVLDTSLGVDHLAVPRHAT